MSRFSIRHTAAAIALSLGVLAAPAAPHALAAGTADLSIRISAPAQVNARQDVSIQVLLNHTGASTSGGKVEVLLPTYFRNVRIGNSTAGYQCSITPDTFFNSEVIKVACSKGSIGNDGINIIARAQSPGNVRVMGSITPLGAVDPDDSDNTASAPIRIMIPPGGLRID